MKPNGGALFVFSPAHWLEVYNYTYAYARQLIPGDIDGAEDIASDCFERFVRIYGSTGLSESKWRNWVTRSLAGLKKTYLREQWGFRIVRQDETDDPLERVRPVAANQEELYDVARWKEKIEALEGRHRDAFRIIADGGNVKDVMEEFGIGPREALAIIHDARRQLRAAA